MQDKGIQGTDLGATKPKTWEGLRFVPPQQLQWLRLLHLKSFGLK
ncbi:unnamed protein product [Calypogeia fissa]